VVARQLAQILAGVKLVGCAKEKGEFAEGFEAFEDFLG
jgi:hypothetical protein